MAQANQTAVRHTAVKQPPLRASGPKNTPQQSIFPGIIEPSNAAVWADVHQGDCLEVLGTEKCVAPQSVDLVITSPPYADQRKSNYGGIHPDQYVEWFMPRAEAVRKVLNPKGSFVLNIKEKVVNGERHTYVLELIMAMRVQGWRWVDEYMWHKRNCYPGKWPNRFRDSWERLLHFALEKDFKMRQEAVKEPVGDWAESRLQNLSDTDKVRDLSRHENGFGKRIANWVGRDSVYPTNVLHLATECGFKGHPATFPKQLPSWFIKLFTDPEDVVLDPFAGLGTTLVAAQELGRHSIGIDTSEKYCELMRNRLSE